MTTTFVLQMFLNGLQLASVYILTALGFTLIFGILHIVNIAHGNIYMLGGYAVWLLCVVLKVNYFVSLVIAIVAVGVFGLVVERAIFRRLQGLVMPTIIASIGLMQVLEQSALIGFGTSEKIVPTPFPGVIRIFGTVFPTQRMAVMLIAIALTVGLVLVDSQDQSRAGTAGGCPGQGDVVALRHQLQTLRLSLFCCGLRLGGSSRRTGRSDFLRQRVHGECTASRTFIIIIIGGLGSVPGTILAGLASRVYRQLCGDHVRFRPGSHGGLRHRHRRADLQTHGVPGS